MSDWQEPCKANLMRPCWYDFTLFQWEREEDGVLNKIAGKHRAKPVEPCSHWAQPLQSQVACPMTVTLSVQPEAQSTFMAVPLRKMQWQHCNLKSGTSKAMRDKSSSVFPDFQNECNYIWLPWCRNWPAAKIAVLSIHCEGIRFPADLKHTVSTQNKAHEVTAGMAQIVMPENVF